jgi:acetoacetyl-CoA reductase
MYADIPEKVKEGLLKRIPLGRTGTPQEVARAVRYLIVDGDYITGQILNINGAFICSRLDRRGSSEDV